MTQLFENNVGTTLSTGLSAAATSMVLTDASGFPDPGSDFYLATLIAVNGSGQETAWEIVRVTAKAGSTLTVVRAQEGTADVTWPSGTSVQMRLTAGSMDGKAAAVHTHTIADTTGLQAALDAKQATLVSGTSIKTVNSTSLLGSGDLAVQATLVSGTNIKTVNGTTLLGSGNLAVGDVVAASNNTLTGANTFGNASGQLFLASTTTTQDGTIITGRAGGSSSFRVTLSPTTLTASRAITFPDAAGTLVLDTATQTLTNKTLTQPVLSGSASGTTAGRLGYLSGALTYGDGSNERTVVNTAQAQTLTNKTLTAPVISTISNTGTLTLPTSTDTLVGRATTDTLTNKTVSGGVYSGVVDQTGSVRGGITAMGALDVDCSAGNYFTKTISGASTFTFSNVPASRAYGFTLELTHTSGTVTWPASVKWPGDTAPTLATGKTHLFGFVTDDGGTRWRGVANVDYVN